MHSRHFYYITDQYFIDFPDPFLMQHKETIHGEIHDRPCFYAFADSKTGLFWLIPFSSQVSKYRNYYEQKLKRYKKCDTIVFGNVLGFEKAFLIQNMCPVTPEYIKNEYLDKVTLKPIRIDGLLEQELHTKSKRVLALQRKGVNLIFPDVLNIEAKLLNKS